MKHKSVMSHLVANLIP